MTTARIPFIAVVCLIALTSCTSSADQSTDSTADSSTAPTSTTTTPLVNPPSGETLIECDAKAISASYGEKVKPERCTQTWAMGDTDRDTWNCPDEGCRDTRLFRLTEGRWTNTAICLRELPLTRWSSSCFIPDVGLATIDRIPPRDVACVLWPTNNLPRWVNETGCPLDEMTVLASLEEKCEGYFEAFALPLVKCNRGELVQKAMVKLRDIGYVRNVDEYFGTEMALGIHRFQKDNALAATGILDDDTWQRLDP